MTPARELSTQMERRINERWQELLPALTLYARRFFPSAVADTLDRLRETHESRVAELLSRGVRLRKIRLHGWDDPRLSVELFARHLTEAVANLRHRRRTVAPRGLTKLTPSARDSRTRTPRDAALATKNPVDVPSPNKNAKEQSADADRS